MISSIVRNRYIARILLQAFCAVLLTGFLLYFISIFVPLKPVLNSTSNTKVHSQPSSNMLEKGKYNVSALVFYGRRRYMEILNCYLEQNLMENGGILFEVIFVSKTNNQEDIKYLHELVSQHPGTYFIRNATNLKWTFHTHYRNLNPNRYYVKIDDDVLYIHPAAINLMLQAKLNNSDAMFITANVINHPDFGKLHLHLRALINTTNALPIEANTGLPICDWTKLDCANVYHHSFLKHYKEKTLDAYVFPIWDYNAFEYRRWSINFFLFKGNEVQDVGPGDDEHQISIVIPRRYKKHSLIVGTALVVHFGYIPQRRSGLKDSEFLPEYRKMAEEVCASTRLSRRNKRIAFGENLVP